MGTLSKRRLEDFGLDVKRHVERFRAQHAATKTQEEIDDAWRPSEGGAIKTAWQTWLAYAGAAVVLVGITSRLVRLAVARARQ